jgi:O-antigen ligase
MPRADAVSALLAAALIAVLGLDQGGWAPTSWVWSAALLGIAAGVLLVGRPVRPSPLELAFLGALAALTVWTLISSAWSLDPTASVLEAQRLLLYLATAGALLLLARPSSRTALLFGVLAAVAALCVTGLVDAAVGDDPVGAVTDDPGSEERLSEPVGYANALALLAAMGVLLALGLAAIAERRALRVACLALVPLLVLTLYLTYGRGGWLALAFGLLVLLGSRVRRVDRRLAGVVAAALILAVAIAATAVVRSFDSATAAPAEGSARLLTASGSSRADYWRVARRDVADHPLLGSGAGSYGRFWLRERLLPQPARDAHSLYLETLAELGPLGFALLLVALGAPVAAAVRTWRDPLTPVALAPYAAYLVHGAQDWDWELPAATVPALVCALTLLLASRRRDEPLGIPARAAAAVAATATAALALAAYAGNRELAVAERGSEDAARRAARLQPWSAAPWRARGEAQLARGEVGRARESFREGIERDDGDWELWLELALASEGAEREGALTRAAELNPLAPEVEQVRSDG